MDTNTITSSAVEQAERNLLEAGFTFTTVDTCPDPQCEVCTPALVCAAA